MSSAPLAPDQHPKNENRRLHARRRIDELIYAKFGPENGGILLNLSEGGLSFQGVGAVGTDQHLRLNFTLPGMTTRIEANGQVVWSNDSGKGGGLRFLDLPEVTRQRLKEWIAQDASSGGTFVAPVEAESAAVVGLGASEGSPVQPLPTLGEKEQPNPPPIEPERHRRKKWPTSSSAPAVASVPTNAGLQVPAFRILNDTRESDAPRASKPQYTAFASGVVAGCVVVLAAIAGLRMLGSPGGPTTPAIGQSPAVQVAPGPDKQNSRVAVLNDKPGTSNNGTVETTPAAAQVSVSKSPVRADEPVPVAPSRTNARRLEDFQPTNPMNRENLALRAPSIPRSPARPDLREPPVGDSAPPGFVSLDARRAAGPGMLDRPKPPPPSAATVDRTASFLEPVPIEQGAPIYPPSAKKKHVEGLVKVSATIGTDGVPRVKVASGDPELTQAAQEAVSRWRYVPAVSGGVPVESNIVITIKFQLKP